MLAILVGFGVKMLCTFAATTDDLQRMDSEKDDDVADVPVTAGININ